jgi:hypothetical protein
LREEANHQTTRHHTGNCTNTFFVKKKCEIFLPIYSLERCRSGKNIFFFKEFFENSLSRLEAQQREIFFSFLQFSLSHSEHGKGKEERIKGFIAGDLSIIFNFYFFIFLFSYVFLFIL